jgi:hypothetical protein
VEAFPWQDPPKYLLRDRDRIYGPAFGRRVAGMGFEEVVTAARSPWQNPFAERAVVELPEVGGLHHHYERVAA